MDPGIDNEWIGYKNERIDEIQNIGNVARSWQWRERGVEPPNYPSNKTVLENAAEDILVQKPLKIRCCDLPGYPRSTFLMVFSPDGTKVASTHGNHNIYVSELASGKHVRILKGHPRTPWCIAFHPSHPQLIGSGCLGGQVRVWDISSGGSEVWNVRNETVIASIAFHPREQLLVIATYNELYFWDWNQPAPYTKVTTNNINEKVRYVAFDALGYKLITGISLWASPGGSTSLLQQFSTLSPSNNQSQARRDDSDDNGNRPQPEGSAQEMIVNSYQNLVQRYDSLVRNYQRLYMVRHRLTSTPPPPNTTDRGTDPMETDIWSTGVIRTSTIGRQQDAAGTSRQNNGNSASTSSAATGNAATSSAATSSAATSSAATSSAATSSAATSSAATNSAATSSAATSSAATNSAATNSAATSSAATSTETNASNSRLLNLDALALGNSPSRNQYGREEPSTFRSRGSAFHPLNDHSGRSFRTVDQNDRVRLLPNPFSSTSSGTSSAPDAEPSADNQAHSSRTSIFTSGRPEAATRPDDTRIRPEGTPRRSHRNLPHARGESSSGPSPRFTFEVLNSLTPWPDAAIPSTSGTSSNQRPTMTNSSTQMSPASTPVDARTINQSLDLIRDILRDSGTRLLNLITNMSITTLASMERSSPRRAGSRPRSDESEGGERVREATPRSRRFRARLRNDLISSSSDSDSDQSLEVNILRTPNSTFREDEPRDTSCTSARSRQQQPTDRLAFELNDDLNNERPTAGPSGINVSTSSSRFHVRTRSHSAGEAPSTSARDPPTGEGRRNQSNRTDGASSSRDNFWTRGGSMPPREAYRKVKGGVTALQRHTAVLTNMWLQASRVTMRQLRNIWDNLRRRVLMLHRQTGNQDTPNHYTRSLLERCMLLTQMTEGVHGSARNPSRLRTENTEGGDRSHDVPMQESNSTSQRNEGTSTPDSDTPLRLSPPRQSSQRRSSIRSSPYLRRRLQSSYRWRPEDELRRRSRNPTVNRLSQRYSNRPRRDFARALEISATRHEIRMRAMQVLSVMFNMMMMCLEERGLSRLIINMLRNLKKSLALTCLILMSNRNSNRAANSPSQQSSRMDALNVVRIENIDHAGPVNVDGPDESPNSFSSGTDEEPSNSRNNDRDAPSTSQTSTATQSTSTRDYTQEASTSAAALSASVQRWSNRLAVQIAAANRNNSVTANNRRKIYLERKRQKALHRTNPLAHPLIKKKLFPPISTHRIPALRSLPRKQAASASSRSVQTCDASSQEPVAGPSSLPPGAENTSHWDSLLSNEFQSRLNRIRLRHIYAMRMRNSARDRRMDPIRLYTPSSVREMFALQSTSSDNQPGSRSSVNAPEGNRRTFATYILPAHHHDRENEEFFTMMNNAPMPLMQVNDLPVAAEVSGSQPQRLPRIHEYLQPIILAQNAMVVEDEANGGGGGGGGGGENGGRGMGPRRMGGMAGLIDAGIISEALPPPSHRVQAWDFTSGATPDIADSTKNVVVQRCRIHNDASIDISKDGRLLVALLPVPRLRNTNHWLGVYSLEWPRLGHCLHTAVLEQSAVSVALSPTARHLAVGLGSRRFTTTPHARNNVFALLYRLEPLENTSRTGLSPIKELEQNWEHGFTSLNCIRWAPQPGQGLVYANNTGQLIIMS